MTTGVNDIVWHNAQTGETQIWLMDRHRITQRMTVVDETGQPIMVGPPFSIVGLGDVNRDGGADIVWHNNQTGETQIWLMDRHRIAQRKTVVDETGQPIMVGPPFSIVGLGDVNRDGGADIVWHNNQTGETQIWLMDRHRITQRMTVVDETGQPIMVGPPFSIVGLGDVNRDGGADIVWHNNQTGETQIWLMDRHRIAQRKTVVDETGQPIMVGPPFSIVGLGDVNRDGGADIVWHNNQTGETQIWLMDRHRIAQRKTVVDETGQPIMVGPPFSIVGLGDVNRDIAREAAEAIDRFHHDRLGMLTVGPALSAPRRLAAGAFEQQFRFGTIMKPLNGEPVITSRFVVAIEVAAIKCFGTEDPGGEDEPYLISAIYAIDPMVREGAVQTARIDFGAVSERQVFGAGHQLAKGFFIPGDGGIRMRVALWDQESARPTNLEKKWGEAAKIAIIAGLTAAKPPAGGAVALLELATGWVGDISDAIGGVVADIFGDDLIAERDFVINADFLTRLVREGSLPRTSGSIPGFRYNFPETPEGGEAGRSWLFEGGGGSYRIFFAVRTERIDLSPLP